MHSAHVRRVAFPIFLAAATPVAIAQAPLYDLSGTTGDEFGHSLAWVGDIDLDGFDDFAIGAPFGDGLQPDAGYVRVFSAKTAAVLWTLRGEQTGDRYGWSVAGIGDINGDGVPDLIVGAPMYGGFPAVDCGAAYAVSGATGVALVKHVGSFTNGWLGWCVASAGDVDGDGVPDYAMSSPRHIVAANETGRVTIHSGATYNFLREYWGANTGDRFGMSLAFAGDCTGDGVPDLVAGAVGYDSGLIASAGRAYLLSGAASNVKTTLATGDSTGGQAGFAVAGDFDFDADGTPDVAVGEPFRNVGGPLAGRVRVISGATHGVLQTIVGTGDEQLGFSLGALADADRDGYGDLIVGLPGGDNGAIHEAGLVNVYSGATGLVLYQWNGYHTGEAMGEAVASAGHLNGDAWTDMLSGAPSSDLHGTDSGRARLILGAAPLPTQYCVAKTNSLGCVPQIIYTGCASVSISDGFHLHGINVLVNKPGIMIWSLNAASTPFFGGTLCVGPPVRRTTAQLATNAPNGGCTGAYDFHFSHAYMAGNGIGAGTNVHAQFWSRDPGFAAPNNIGLTNGLRFLTLP